MAKPILGNPVLRGEAAAEFKRYLDSAKPDPKKEKEYREGIATHKPVSK